MPGDADFTPNPKRAVWVEGKMCEGQLERLRPEILELTRQSREPITLFINSNGGSDVVGRGLLSLLRRTTEDDARASRIITVAAPRAASSAANLLSAGDFAIAYPESRLLYHGARWPLPVEELTGEWARIGRTLATFHEMAAMALARASLRRFSFIVFVERELFGQHRADNGNPTLTDLGCFQAILRGHLSRAAQEVLEIAIPLADIVTKPVNSETYKQNGCQVPTMVLSEAHTLSLFRVIRDGLGSSKRLCARGAQRLTYQRRLALEPERLRNRPATARKFSRG